MVGQGRALWALTLLLLVAACLASFHDKKRGFQVCCMLASAVAAVPRPKASDPTADACALPCPTPFPRPTNLSRRRSTSS